MAYQYRQSCSITLHSRWQVIDTTQVQNNTLAIISLAFLMIVQIATLSFFLGGQNRKLKDQGDDIKYLTDGGLDKEWKAALRREIDAYAILMDRRFTNLEGKLEETRKEVVSITARLGRYRQRDL